MQTVKPFLSYADQVKQLKSRGMLFKDSEAAVHQLSVLHYYRLSAYWHSMREPNSENFKPGTSFELVMDIYRFDEQIRAAIFTDVARIESAMRALIGHYLGQVNPLIHTRPGLLSNTRKKNRANQEKTNYEFWFQRYQRGVRNNQKEEFVKHHLEEYGGKLPIWVAVETMDWGTLSCLYEMAPLYAGRNIAKKCRLNSAQLGSWLKCLNILRNLAAHHDRIVNRNFTRRPRLPDDPRLPQIDYNRAFGQLTLIQYLLKELRLPGGELLPSVLDDFPHNDLIPFERMGAPKDWRSNTFWAVD